MARQSCANRPEMEPKEAKNIYARTDLLKSLSEYVSEALPLAGFEEVQWWSNVRIFLCVVCCSLGCWAQFGTKFPEDRMILAVCVAGYFVGSGIISAIDYFVISHSVVCIKIGSESVFVDINLPVANEEVTLSLRSGRRTEMIKKSIGQYFHSDGILSEENLFGDVCSLVAKR